jgi:hypothetical protein
LSNRYSTVAPRLAMYDISFPALKGRAKINRRSAADEARLHLFFKHHRRSTVAPRLYICVATFPALKGRAKINRRSAADEARLHLFFKHH